MSWCNLVAWKCTKRETQSKTSPVGHGRHLTDAPHSLPTGSPTVPTVCISFECLDRLVFCDEMFPYKETQSSEVTKHFRIFKLSQVLQKPAKRPPGGLYIAYIASL